MGHISGDTFPSEIFIPLDNLGILNQLESAASTWSTHRQFPFLQNSLLSPTFLPTFGTFIASNFKLKKNTNSAPSLSLLAVSWKSHTLTKLLECSMLTNQTIHFYYNFTISLKSVRAQIKQYFTFSDNFTRNMNL